MADSMLSTVPSWLPVGMDPLTTYLLEIKLARDRKNARVEYDWFIFSKVIDSNAMCYKDFIDDIAKSYPWGPNETVTIGYVDMVHKITHHVTTDQDMLTMFEKFVDIKVIPMIIRIHGINESIDELDHTLVKASACVPDTPSLATPSQVDFSQPSSSTLPSHVIVPSDTYLVNSFPMAEHVGVDEEGIYLDEEEAVVGHADETRDEGAVNEVSEDESWATSEDESEDASEDDGVNESEDESMASDGMPEHIPIATYDKNDPPMIVGSVYPNINEFRLAIAQHAIKKEFEYNIIRSEPGQFTASCAAKGCKWRIHASVVADGVTMMKSAGRPRTMRYKGWTEKGSKRSRRHKCPICKSYGHHWHNCKEGDPEEVAAMLAERGPPKKRTKKTNEATSETSIMAAPIVTPIMAYPPSQNFNFTEDNRTLNNSSGSSISIRSRSLTGSNQPEPSNMIVALPCLGEETPTVAPKMTKSKTKGKSSCSSTPGSPAMSTRSKNKSPAMGTRSKRKLMD
ncbi:hypothetical protein OsJ_01924 [Oryza sativa Japonica Group]|uniref:Transposase MuDR plant domain-containing protein n=1 Tax=Oryza sativa subsp. japonica TaxID=39947 RepID=A2ZTJ6_ORYSJ|nr:hypothetical protein OsJ_01924 [Oryza sativa Japonica Group]